MSLLGKTKLYVRDEMEEHLKRREGLEELYKSNLNEMRINLEMKLEKAKEALELQKRQRIEKFSR